MVPDARCWVLGAWSRGGEVKCGAVWLWLEIERVDISIFQPVRFHVISHNECVVKFPLVVPAVGCLPLRLGHAIRPLRRWAYLHNQPSTPLDAVSLQFHCPQPYARDLFFARKLPPSPGFSSRCTALTICQ